MGCASLFAVITLCLTVRHANGSCREYTGREVVPGMTFFDGCNYCRCSQLGTTAACTRRVCIDLGTPIQSSNPVLRPVKPIMSGQLRHPGPLVAVKPYHRITPVKPSTLVHSTDMHYINTFMQRANIKPVKQMRSIKLVKIFEPFLPVNILQPILYIQPGQPILPRDRVNSKLPFKRIWSIHSNEAEKQIGPILPELPNMSALQVSTQQLSSHIRRPEKHSTSSIHLITQAHQRAQSKPYRSVVMSSHPIKGIYLNRRQSLTHNRSHIYPHNQMLNSK